MTKRKKATSKKPLEFWACVTDDGKPKFLFQNKLPAMLWGRAVKVREVREVTRRKR